MRITARQLRQVIREEYAAEVATSSRAREEDLGVTEDKMFNSKISVEGLTKAEFEATKGAADLSMGAAGFFVIDNASQYPVQVILADLGKTEGARDRFEIAPRSRSKFIGFSKEALTRGPPRPARILMTGAHAKQDYEQAYTTVKLARPSVSEFLNDKDYAGVLIKLSLSTGRIETPAAEEEPALAATKAETYITPEFVAAVTKQPLQLGSKGDNVGIAQRAIKAALQRFISLRGVEGAGGEFDIPQEDAAEIMRYVPGIPKNASSKQILTALVTALEDDGKFGNITKTAVRMYQSRAGITVDGKVGKNTASSLQADNMSITESIQIINRWNKLAGLLKD